jgi:hypothetical protein
MVVKTPIDQLLNPVTFSKCNAPSKAGTATEKAKIAQGTSSNHQNL